MLRNYLNGFVACPTPWGELATYGAGLQCAPKVAAQESSSSVCRRVKLNDFIKADQPFSASLKVCLGSLGKDPFLVGPIGRRVPISLSKKRTLCLDNWSAMS